MYILLRKIRSYRVTQSVSHNSYLAEQCWRDGCISFIILRHVKQKAPPPPCSVIGSIRVPLISGDEQNKRTHTENSDDVPHTSFPCNWESKDSELQSYSKLCESSFSLDSCETSGSILSAHTLTNQNPDNFCKDGPALPACLHHRHPVEFQMKSFKCETSNQV